MTRLRVKKQGRVVVRTEGTQTTVAFPDGRERSFSSHRRAERAVREWLHRRSPPDGVGLAEVVYL